MALCCQSDARLVVFLVGGVVWICDVVGENSFGSDVVEIVFFVRCGQNRILDAN